MDIFNLRRKKPYPTREGLLNLAYHYFMYCQQGLTSGSIKARVGELTITISFTTGEEKIRS